MSRKQMTVEQFWANTKRDESTECLLWQKSKDSQGYGMIRWNGKTERTHRVAWKIINGSIPDGFELHHRPTCNKSCCEIKHLTLITVSEHRSLTHKLGQIKNYATGLHNGAYTHPENRPRGDRQGLRKHPERAARGLGHRSVTHPQSIPRGNNHYKTKIKDEQIPEILELRKKGVLQRIVGTMYGVTGSQIGRIERGESRKNK